MDVSMPLLNGIDATRRICQQNPATKVIAISAHREPRMATSIMAAGALGYVLKDSAFQELATAIRAVVAGKTYISPDVASAESQGTASTIQCSTAFLPASARCCN